MYLPTDRAVRTAQLDLDPRTVGTRMPTEAPVVGDVAEGVRALLPMLTRQTDRSFLEKAQASMGSWRQDMAALEDPRREPIAPQYLMHTVDELATNDAILTWDSRSGTAWQSHRAASR